MTNDEPVSSVDNIENILLESVSASKLFYALLIGNFFFLIVLFSPDSTVLDADANLKIPILGESVSMRGFLVFGPIILISITLYGQAIIRNEFISYSSHNLNIKIEPTANIIILFVFYCFTPVSIFILWWTALPRPESPLLFSLFLFYLFLSGLINILHPFKNKVIIAYISCCFVILMVFFFSYIALIYFSPGELERYRSLHLVQADLSKKDLRSVNLITANMDYVDFNGSNLENANLKGVKASSANFKNSILKQTVFDDATLVKSDFTSADLRKASFRGAYLANANFNKAELSDTIFIDADLPDANFTEADLFDAILIKATLFNANFLNADISGAQFHSATLLESSFKKVNGDGAHFLLAYLVKTKMTEGAMLESADFQFADMSDAKLDDSYFYGAEFNCAKMTNVNAKLANLSEGNFNNTDFTGANLDGAKLHNANFMCANLTDANLTKADFKSAKLRFTNFKNSNLREALNLECEQLKEALNLSTSNFPEYLSDCKYTKSLDGIVTDAINICKKNAEEKKKEIITILNEKEILANKNIRFCYVIKS